MTIAVILIIVAGIAIGVYAWMAPRRAERVRVQRPEEPLKGTTDWTNEAGDEFAGLSESARCDLIFAVAALDDERSQHLLEHALNDPAEAVSLAAAHVLISSGRRNTVESFLSVNPGRRADRIAQTLSLLDSQRSD